MESLKCRSLLSLCFRILWIWMTKIKPILLFLLFGWITGSLVAFCKFWFTGGSTGLISIASKESDKFEVVSEQQDDFGRWETGGLRCILGITVFTFNFFHDLWVLGEIVTLPLLIIFLFLLLNRLVTVWTMLISAFSMLLDALRFLNARLIFLIFDLL